MFSKPSETVLEAAKQKLEEWFKKRILSPDYADGGYGCVACLFAREKDNGDYIFNEIDSQACHYSVPKQGRTAHFVLDSIQKPSLRKRLGNEVKVAFLQYVMDHPIFKHSFWEHDAKKAVAEGVMVRRVDKLPSNVTMFCFILTRALWEDCQIKLPPRFSRLLEMGMHPDRAFIGAHFFSITEDDTLKYSPNLNSGHTAIPTNQFNSVAIKNFLNHFVASPGIKTITQGGETSGNTADGNVACVNSVFEVCKKSYRDDGLGDGSKIPIDINSVKLLDNWFDKIMREKVK